MKQSTLPKGWKVVTSKSHPDRVYYFNVKTNKSSWRLPQEKDEMTTPKQGRYSRKRNRDDDESDDDESTPASPPMTSTMDDNSRLDESEQRRKLQGKRSRQQKSVAENTLVTDTSRVREKKRKNLEIGASSDDKLTAPDDKDDDGAQSESEQRSVLRAKRIQKPESVENTPRKSKRKQESADGDTSNIGDVSCVDPRLRPKLQAKRSIQPRSTSPEIETPQMREIREKMIRRMQQAAQTKQKQGGKKGKPATCVSPPGSPERLEVLEPLQRESPTTTQVTKDTTARQAVSPKGTKRTSRRSSARLVPVPTSETESPAKAGHSSVLPVIGKKSIVSDGGAAPLLEIEDDASLSNVSTHSATKTGRRSKQGSRSVVIAKKTDVPSPVNNIIANVNLTPDNERSTGTVLISKKVGKGGNNNFDVSVALNIGTNVVPRKNIAQARMENLRRSLERTTDDEPPVQKKDKRLSFSPSKVAPNNNNYRTPSSLYKNAEARMRSLEARLENGQAFDNSQAKRRQPSLSTSSPANRSVTLENLIQQCSSEPYYEEMEWEPIEDEKIMFEVQVVRSQLCSDDPMASKGVQENTLDLFNTSAQIPGQELFIVIDTNVFLSKLQAIEEARDAVFRTHGRPIIVVPWTVIRELDYIKDNKDSSRTQILQAKARRAIKFLNFHFSSKHPRVKGQTPEDVERNREKFFVDCPDDEILQTCLQIRDLGKTVVLLSYDQNLCNKAMIYDLITLGKQDPLEKIDFLSASNKEERTWQASDEPEDSEENELLLTDDIFEETKAVLKSFLTKIVALEMQKLYGDLWEKYTIIKPPWSCVDVLKCALKHWIAAVGESFLRRAESLLKDLLQIIQNVPPNGRKLADVIAVLDKCNDLVQMAKVEKYADHIYRTSKSLEELKQRSEGNTKLISERKLRNEFGSVGSFEEQERRAEKALLFIEELYVFARDVCGMACEALGMPCSILYKKANPPMRSEDIKEMQPELAANVNRLLQTLSGALEEVNLIHIDHRAVKALYHALVNFTIPEIREIDRELTPLDVYCCLKNKQDTLKRGLHQLQEVSGHFCRMAIFRCT
ncbi:transcriptional protein SWT1 [Orussus abietinus]|uniref:transcriptional protein SWT1 n=1 Tax=Orussus abietinus TaxID=222816 RepID=UPI000625C1A9|nr:transcriptional protein SWT1 [Orussus abietinus]